MIDQLLHDILTSRVYDVARETPLDPAARLSRRLGNTVFLKRADQQPVFSFKLRGAYNRIAHCRRGAPAAAHQPRLRDGRPHGSGFEVPDSDMGAFQGFLVGLGYDHVHEDENAAYNFFLR